MILKINQLTNSDIEAVRKIAWLIYERDNGTNGLSENDVEEILYLLSDLDKSIAIELERMEQTSYDEGAKEGYREGYSEARLLYCND